MKFLLDVCVSSRSLQAFLVAQGHDALSAIAIDPKASDERLMAMAHQDERVFVTEDKDFGDTSTTEKKAKDFLQARFEACYPFHPATLSVFQRKWQTLSQFQQTRGTLAMLAQWISKAAEDGYIRARREPLITLGSAPLDVPEFRSVVLGQLGESRLLAAIDTDIAGERSHARTLDADTTGVLHDIHRRVGTTILFESSGGQVHKVAHLPELRFALGEPEVDTTSVDTAAVALEAKAFFIQRVGTDGFKVYHKAKIDKAVHDRRASLDEDDEIKPTIRTLVKDEIKRVRASPSSRSRPTATRCRTHHGSRSSYSTRPTNGTGAKRSAHRSPSARPQQCCKTLPDP